MTMAKVLDNSESMKKGLYVQGVLLFLFVLLNSYMFTSGEPVLAGDGTAVSPVIANASDGQRYWGVATSLVNGDGFTISENDSAPLKRAGPIPAVVFAGIILIMGPSSAPLGIVFVQCFLLYFSSLIAGRLGDQYQVPRTAIQVLLLFNPSLVSLAHHAQSEILFLFFFSCLLVLVNRILHSPDTCRMKEYVLLGTVCGLLTLTRPLGFYFGIFLPFIVLIVVLLSRRFFNIRWFRVLGGLALVILFAAVVTTPWALRNKAVIGSLTLTHSEGIMAEWHYSRLQEFRRDVLGKQVGSIESWKKNSAKEYFSEVLEIPITETVLGLGASWGKLFLNPGVSQMARYLGQPPPDAKKFWDLLIGSSTGEGIASIWREFSPAFFVLFVAGLAYTIVSRSLGILGLISVGFRRPVLRYTLFYGVTVGIFLCMYLFSSIARFRAPLEPILALFAVVGVCFFANGIRKRAGKS